MGDLGFYSQRTRLCSVYGDFHLRDAQLTAQGGNVKKPLVYESGFLLWR